MLHACNCVKFHFIIDGAKISPCHIWQYTAGVYFGGWCWIWRQTTQTIELWKCYRWDFSVVKPRQNECTQKTSTETVSITHTHEKISSKCVSHGNRIDTYLCSFFARDFVNYRRTGCLFLFRNFLFTFFAVQIWYRLVLHMLWMCQ